MGYIPGWVLLCYAAVEQVLTARQARDWGLRKSRRKRVQMRSDPVSSIVGLGSVRPTNIILMMKGHDKEKYMIFLKYLAQSPKPDKERA